MRKLLINSAVLLLLNNGPIKGQAVFQKSFGGSDRDYFFDLRQTADSGYILTGSYADDLVLIKTDSQGDTLWTRTYPMAQGGCLRSVIQTTDGGYAMTGNVGFQPVLMKTDSNGNLEWVTLFGLATGKGNDLLQSNDGGYVITGSYISVIFSNIFIAKTDSSGTMLWVKTTGNFLNENVSCIKQTSDQGFVIAGSAEIIITYGNMLLIKTDSAGDILWSKAYVEPSVNTSATMVLQTGDGGYIFSGSSDSCMLCVVKTDSAGTLLWSKYYNANNAPDPGRRSTGINKTVDGGYVLAAESNANYSLILVKIDSTGTVIFDKSYAKLSDYYDYLSGSAYQTFDGGYVVAGSAKKSGTVYDYDLYLIKTDSLGLTACNFGGNSVAPAPYSITASDPGLSSQAPSVIMYNPVLIPGGGIPAYHLCGPTGIPDAGTIQNSISISPNPSPGRFVVHSKTPVNGKVEIFNLLGESVFEELLFNESEKAISLDLEPGIYFVKVLDGEKRYCSKLVVERDL